MTETSKQLARDVASELQRRKRNRRLGLLVVLALLIAAAITFVTCGKGWGLGGTGSGSGDGSGTGSARGVAGPTRCAIRVAADGVSVDGVKHTRDEAVSICKKTEGATVTVTGDARQGDWDELRAALEAVGVKIFMRGQLGD